jgi:hypothetical protein
LTSVVFLHKTANCKQSPLRRKFAYLVTLLSDPPLLSLSQLDSKSFRKLCKKGFQSFDSSEFETTGCGKFGISGSK